MNTNLNRQPTSVQTDDVRILNDTVTHLFHLHARLQSASGNFWAGTVRYSRLHKKEEPASKSGQCDQIRAWTDVHPASADDVRNGITKVTDADDFSTVDLLDKTLRDLEIQLWLLEAQLDQK